MNKQRIFGLVIAVGIGVVVGIVRGEKKPKPRDEWAESYAALRERDTLTKWPVLERRALPGMSIAVPPEAVLADGATRAHGQLALGDIKDMVKPAGRGVIVFWREGTLTEALPSAGDPVAEMIAWSASMGEAGAHAGKPEPYLMRKDAYSFELATRVQRASVVYFACKELVVGLVAWDEKLPIGGHIASSFRCD